MLSTSPSPLESNKLQKTERTIFIACLVYAIVSTLVWLYFIITQRDGGIFFKKYNLTAETVQNVIGAFISFWVIWSYLFYLLKNLLLKKIGVTKEDREIIFSTRKTGFELQKLLEKYPERKIRIIDMLGRRLRTSAALMVSFLVLAAEIKRNPGPDSLAISIQGGFLEAIFLTWWSIIAYMSNGIAGHIAYGAHARIMDGKLGRSNALLIGNLWGLFKFIMIPIGIKMAIVFPPETFATLFIFIWFSYVVSDMMGEIVGSVFGKQSIKVMGIGEVNRKSVAGTLAVFFSSLISCTIFSFIHGQPPIWLLVGLIISVSNTFFELFSPRGTDDITMATANALICLLFGMLYYG